MVKYQHERSYDRDRAYERHGLHERVLELPLAVVGCDHKRLVLRFDRGPGESD